MTIIAEGHILREKIEEGGPRPFLLVNADAHVTGTKIFIPPEVLNQIPAGIDEVAVYWTTLGAIREAGIQSARQNSDFIAGRPVLVTPRQIEWLGDRSQGGQNVEGDEKAALKGLCTVVVLTTETIRGCRDAKEHRKLDIEVRRQDILSEMTLPLSPASCFKRGQAGLKDWFPGLKASTVMNDAYRSPSTRPGAHAGWVDYTVIEADQLGLVHTASAIYEKVLQFRKAQQAMSDAELAGVPVPNATWMELAHAKQNSPSLDELMAAAIAMAFNPARVFTNVYSFAIVFDIGISLGRVQRGFDVFLPQDQIEKLAALMAQADAADDGEPAHINDTDRLAQRLRTHALKVKTREGWQHVFDMSRQDNRGWRIPSPIKHG